MNDRPVFILLEMVAQQHFAIGATQRADRLFYYAEQFRIDPMSSVLLQQFLNETRGWYGIAEAEFWKIIDPCAHEEELTKRNQVAKMIAMRV